MCSLEFFVTAWMVPVVLSLIYQDKMTIFGVLSADKLSNFEGAFNDSWYVLNGEGIFLQMFIYLGLNNFTFTYGLDVFPKWHARRNDKRDDYTEAHHKNNIPNTK